MAWVRAPLCKFHKRCTRLAAASDKVYQLLAHGWWFSPGTLASSTTKTGRNNIAEVLLKVALYIINKSINQSITQNADEVPPLLQVQTTLKGHILVNQHESNKHLDETKLSA
jgi:hypothetical protein